MIVFLIMIAYILGIILGLYIKNIALFFIFLLILLIILIIVLHLLFFKRCKKKVFYLLLICFIIFLISFTNIKYLEKSFKAKFDNIDLKNRQKISATIISNKKSGKYNNTYIIKIKTIDGSNRYKNTKLLLSTNKKDQLCYGDEINFIGSITPLIEIKNYNDFDYKEYLKTNKLYGTVKLYSIKSIDNNKYFYPLILINNLKLKLIDNSTKLFGESDEKNLLTGILIGDKDNLSDDIKNDFKQSNLSHVLAVSGMHTSYVILGITYLLTNLNINKRASKIITIFILVIFSILTNMTPSVVRACLMASYIIFGSLIHRKPSMLVSICFSLIVILIFNPYKLYDIGLQLSYGGTIGIIVFYRPLKEKIIKRFNTDSKAIKAVLDMFIVSVCANIVILPICAYYFNTISLTFFISNILVGQLIGPIIIIGFSILLISLVSINFASLFKVLIILLLKLLILITKVCSKIPLSNIQIPKIPIIFIFIYYFVLIKIVKRGKGCNI